MRRSLALLGAVGLAALLAAGGYLATRTPTETYTPAVAGVVAAAREGPGYALAGREGWVDVDRFVVGGPAAVGDVLLAGEGSPTWAYAARAASAGCWVVYLSGGGAHVEGDWIDADAGSTNLLPAVDVHLRIPRSASFSSPVAVDGQLLGRTLCLDAQGRVASAH